MIKIPDILNFLGLFLNILGTILILKGTYGLEPPPFAFLGGNSIDEQENRIRNIRRLKKQKLGLVFLILGCFLQILAIIHSYKI